MTPSAPPAPNDPVQAQIGSKVLVIDDEVAILRLLKTLLGRANYEVTTAESAREALKLLEERSFDCILTDAVMPQLSGYDFVKEVRSQPRHRELPILMLTCKRNRQDVKRAVEVGVTDYILKPIDENLLLEKLESSLKKGGAAIAAYEQSDQFFEAEAEISVGCHVVSLTERGLTVQLPFEITQDLPFHLRSRIFQEIGISEPQLKLESCEQSEEGWEARLALVNVAESDLQKIRAWLERGR